MNNLESANLKNVAIFTGYSHLGTCREFTWIPGDVIGRKQMPSRFILKGLVCEYDVEALMIRKDLYLRTDAGQEYIVNNFQITDINDAQNISGVAESCGLLFEKFPEMKTIVDGEKVVVSKESQVKAFKALSGVVNDVKMAQGIDSTTINGLSQQLVTEILQSPDSIVNLVDIKSFDDYTFTHNVNVSILSILIGSFMQLTAEQLYELGCGAILHDVGKLKISLSILNKDEKLTPTEFEEIKRHPNYGYEILSKSKGISEHARLVALQHHEKFNGAGYPKGLKGRDISLLARICAIADVYDALTTDRPYRVAMTPYDAMKILTSGMETHFDNEVLSVFVRKFSLYPAGSLVRLNDNSIGLVLRVNPTAIIRPVIKIIRTSTGQGVKTRQEINLLNEKGLFICGPATGAQLNITN